MTDQLTLLPEDTLVSHSAPPAGGEESPKTGGLKCMKLSKEKFPNMLLPKMLLKNHNEKQKSNYKNSDTKQTLFVLGRKMQGQTIKEIVGGYLHTPTTKANFTAPSMQKWSCCRNYVTAFGGGKITPEQFEFLMGYPIGWTEIKR